MDETRARFDTLTKGAFLDVLLPKDPDLDVAAILRSETPESIGQTPSRRNLFFGASRLGPADDPQPTETQSRR